MLSVKFCAVNVSMQRIDVPVMGKPTKVRIGRGKGNRKEWIARVSMRQIPFEML